ncbi:TetR/AcrR family transcriptional regulator [Pseudocolwellia sp. AS88]|uniref:TetR/AcrR family transcriptional regulator n=1 Tax=Pseudocolwellia sp. AS88 TaxID=3063958 RepID=UPI0026E9A3CE|nr:TetR/AcrR family transcriptional regulator [Pseudocolwellia sp. AS88]MDO7084533.1 TetR/AcrR family transcriptional regulator [Pseudocolwellia sp. AS88]
MQKLNDTAHKILDIAEFFTQTKGFNAFSYKDIQTEMGIKTSSIHYYFPTKKHLALAMTERYVNNFQIALLNIRDQYPSGVDQIQNMTEVYIDVVKQNKFCMCGMLASELTSICDASVAKLIFFFEVVQNWVEEAITLGQEQSLIKKDISAKATATGFVSVIEGAMLIARAKGEPEHLINVMNNTIGQLKA